MTGGSGFVGRWILETFIAANRAFGLNARATVLTRHPERFHAAAPDLATDPSVTLLRGNVLDFEPPREAFSWIIHAAAPAHAERLSLGPTGVWEAIVLGTRRVLQLASACDASRFLFVSSGAVYAPLAASDSLTEDHAGISNAFASGDAYGEAKRAAESLCAYYSLQHSFATPIARCFAFIGPHMPLNAELAAGNFLRDALAGGPIRVHSRGTAVRSYLHAADLAIWLWGILARGESRRPYNVGSERAVTIRQLAELIADSFDPPLEVLITGEFRQERAPRYVPSTRRIQSELDLRETIPLEAGILRTIDALRGLPAGSTRSA